MPLIIFQYFDCHATPPCFAEIISIFIRRGAVYATPFHTPPADYFFFSPFSFISFSQRIFIDCRLSRLFADAFADFFPSPSMPLSHAAALSFRLFVIFRHAFIASRCLPPCFHDAAVILHIITLRFSAALSRLMPLFAMSVIDQHRQLLPAPRVDFHASTIDYLIPDIAFSDI